MYMYIHIYNIHKFCTLNTRGISPRGGYPLCKILFWRFEKLHAYMFNEKFQKLWLNCKQVLRGRTDGRKYLHEDEHGQTK